jgi:hypothetical protein
MWRLDASATVGPLALLGGDRRRESSNMEDQDIGMVLDVTPGDHEGFERHLLEGMGHRVEVCHGPEGHNCPLLEEGTCELVDQAHGIVFKLDLDREYHRQILARYRMTMPVDAPIAVAVEPGQEREYFELLDGLYVWNHQPTAADLDGFAALVEAADRTH